VPALAPVPQGERGGGQEQERGKGGKVAMIERMLRIILAYLATCITAGFVVAVVMMHTGVIATLVEGRSLSHAPVAASPAYALLWLTWMSAILATFYVLLPAAIIIAIAEVRRWRSAALYAAAGAGVACLWAGVVLLRDSGPYAVGSWAFAGSVLGLPGLIGGLVYWWIAGRTAGEVP
jgi:hypothetical protein